MVPLTPNPYRGSDLKQRRKAAEHNALAERVVAHLNKRIADDPDEDQSYNYGFVAKDLGLTAEQIRLSRGSRRSPWDNHSRAAGRSQVA